MAVSDAVVGVVADHFVGGGDLGDGLGAVCARLTASSVWTVVVDPAPCDGLTPDK